jgi:hypothetical protein
VHESSFLRFTAVVEDVDDLTADIVQAFEKAKTDVDGKNRYKL